jgi:hypothetical protein
MERVTKILIILLLVIGAGNRGFAQVVTHADSLRLMEQKGRSAENADEQKVLGNMNSQQATMQAGKKNPSQSVKRIKGSRPDMSKARGARPPSVVRPAGSGIPKGVGKPGGVGRKGGR